MHRIFTVLLFSLFLVPFSWSQEIISSAPGTVLQWDCDPFEVVILGEGTNFQQGSNSIWFSQGSNTVFPFDDYSIDDETAIGLFLNSFDACGTFDLNVSNPIDGQMVLPGALEVLCPEIISVSPEQVDLGALTNVWIAGENMDFTQGSNTLNVWYEQGSNTVFYDAFPVPASPEVLVSNLYVPPGTLCEPLDVTIENGCGASVTLEDAIEIDCVGGVQGGVFLDLNDDGQYSFGEPSYPNAFVEIQPLGIWIATDGLGVFSMELPDGQYTVSLVVPDNFALSTTPATYSVQVSQGTFISGLNFGLAPLNAEIQDVEISASIGPLEENQPTPVWITYKNVGNVVVNSGTVNVAIEGVQFIPGTDSPNADAIDLNGGSWSYQDLVPGESRTIVVLAIPIGIPPLAYTLGGDITPISGDANPANNTFVEQGPTWVNTGSYLKTSSPPGTDPQHHYTDLEDGPLTYTIKFELSAFEPVQNVLVIDELDENLDPTTFELIGASFPVAYQLNGNEVQFEAINQLWTFSVPQFIQFRVYPKPDVENGTVIYNTANITVNETETVMTNTAFNTLDGIIDYVDEPGSPSWQVMVMPNPASDLVQLKVMGPHPDGPFEVEFFDARGALLEKRQGASGQIYLDVHDWATGLYLFRITDQLGKTLSGKLMVE